MQRSLEYSGSSATRASKPSVAARLIELLIRIYRLSLSPIFGNSCRFFPTCSRYAEQAVREHGALAGSRMAARRVLRCHPWHDGGYDPVPRKNDRAT